MVIVLCEDGGVGRKEGCEGKLLKGLEGLSYEQALQLQRTRSGVRSLDTALPGRGGLQRTGKERYGGSIDCRDEALESNREKLDGYSFVVGRSQASVIDCRRQKGEAGVDA